MNGLIISVKNWVLDLSNWVKVLSFFTLNRNQMGPFGVPNSQQFSRMANAVSGKRFISATLIGRLLDTSLYTPISPGTSPGTGSPSIRRPENHLMAKTATISRQLASMRRGRFKSDKYFLAKSNALAACGNLAERWGKNAYFSSWPQPWNRWFPFPHFRGTDAPFYPPTPGFSKTHVFWGFGCSLAILLLCCHFFKIKQS